MACRVTHVLLAVSCLARRADGVEVIGAALTAKAGGLGHRRIAVRFGQAGLDGAGLATRVRWSRGRAVARSRGRPG